MSFRYYEGTMEKLQKEFVQACREYNIVVVKDLLAKGVDPAAYNNLAIRYACKNGHTDIVKMLLNDTRVDHNYAIRVACYNGHIDIVKLLLADTRVDPSANDN